LFACFVKGLEGRFSLFQSLLSFILMATLNLARNFLDWLKQSFEIRGLFHNFYFLWSFLNYLANM